MSIKSKLVVASVLFSMGAVGCGGMPEEGEVNAPENAQQAPTQDMAKQEQELLGAADIPCGQTKGFPTWFAWGTTTLDMTNLGYANGSKIHVMIQAGVSPSEFVDVQQHESVPRVFGGFTANVTNLGYYDAAGAYHSCLDNTIPPDAPTLRVQAY